MTTEEEAQLRELGKDLAGALHSLWEPACLARAFATPGEGALVFTMQGWIDLDAARSPLLAGGLPETLEEIEAAVDAFRCGPVDLSPDEAEGLGRLMREEIEAAFALGLRMRAPGAETGAEAPDGFGTWLPLWACLVTQCGLAPDAALALRVGRAFALVAGMRRNQGWECAGTTYALRGEELSVERTAAPLVESQSHPQTPPAPAAPVTQLSTLNSQPS